jgi:predicted ribosome quality control (RQC) complex YloA/Tae2 family protein
MALSATEIGSIVQELAPALADGWIQKISQPLPDGLLLEIRVPGHARIDGITHVPGDRIVRLDLTSRDGPVTLIAELFGRNTDLLFLDGETRVLATLRHNRDRVGQVYQAPASVPLRSSPSETATPN